MLRGYSWLYTQELFLAVLRGPYGMLEIEPGSGACKANALPTVLSLQPHHSGLAQRSWFVGIMGEINYDAAVNSLKVEKQMSLHSSELLVLGFGSQAPTGSERSAGSELRDPYGGDTGVFMGVWNPGQLCEGSTLSAVSFLHSFCSYFC